MTYFRRPSDPPLQMLLRSALARQAQLEIDAEEGRARGGADALELGRLKADKEAATGEAARAHQVTPTRPPLDPL